MSLQKTSLPEFLMFDGGWIATAGVVLVVVDAVVVAAFLLLPPQPAERSTDRESAASPAKRVFVRFIVLPFRFCWGQALVRQTRYGRKSYSDWHGWTHGSPVSPLLVLRGPLRGSARARSCRAREPSRRLRRAT